MCIISKIVREANFISPNPTSSLTTSSFLFLLPFFSDLSLTTLEFNLFVSEIELRVNTPYLTIFPLLSHYYQNVPIPCPISY